MSETPARPPVRTVTEEAREATLDMAAAALAAIHTAKQVASESAPFGSGLSPLRHQPTLPFGLGDLLFGAAQLQVDFARRLFEFNRGASKLLRERLHDERAAPAAFELCITTKEQNVEALFTVKNRARLSKHFEFACSEPSCKFREAGSSSHHHGGVTVPGGHSACVVAQFQALRPGIHRGEIAVLSQGIKVESIPYTITVKAASDE